MKPDGFLLRVCAARQLSGAERGPETQSGEQGASQWGGEPWTGPQGEPWSQPETQGGADLLRRKQTPRDKPEVKPEGSRHDTKKPKPTRWVWTGHQTGGASRTGERWATGWDSHEGVEGRPGALIAQAWWPRPSHLSRALITHFAGRHLTPGQVLA